MPIRYFGGPECDAAMVLRRGRLIQAPAGARAARGLARASLPLARIPWRADEALRSMTRQTPT